MYVYMYACTRTRYVLWKKMLRKIRLSLYPLDKKNEARMMIHPLKYETQGEVVSCTGRGIDVAMWLVSVDSSVHAGRPTHRVTAAK